MGVRTDGRRRRREREKKKKEGKREQKLEGETWSENNSDRFALLSEREKEQVRLGMSIKSLRSSYSKRLLVNRSALTCKCQALSRHHLHL